MSIIFWNCQWLDNALIVQTLREMVRSHLFDFSNGNQAEKLQHEPIEKTMWIPFGINIKRYGTAGGLCLWWKPCANVQIVSSSKNLIDTFIHLKNENLLFHASFVYGPPYRDEKLPF
ncbi:hypothetical protein ACFX11_013103 [Malus domestica]